MDLIHPSSKAEVLEALSALSRSSSASAMRVLIVGGRTHMGRAGVDAEPAAELWTTQLDRVVSYEPAEMIAVVEAGMRVGDLAALLAERGQEWPVDAPPTATVGGVIAAGVSSPRRLKVGHIRDTVLELELVTGDGRLIRSGARTVKNVTGYDIHRLATGSFGRLGVIVQAALKVRPLPESRFTLTAKTANVLQTAAGILDRVPWVSAVTAEPGSLTVYLEGWTEEVQELAGLARDACPDLGDAGNASLWDRVEGTVVAEVSVAPSRLADAVDDSSRWRALVGVGLGWVGLENEAELDRLRERVHGLGGFAPVIEGPGGRDESQAPAPEVQKRLRESFDPARILLAS